ncbi:MAG: small subunit ribosomal protein [Thermoplasmata archaeon]|jgi:small subunit ribosomal protein S17|nr:small subunit ribosomal protein [Thermoplasmata archaeon]
MAKARDIGVDVQAPKADCTDPHCPFHGGFSVRGQTIEGQVVSTRMERSARVQREYLRYVPKYERYEKRTSSYNVHAPPCLNVQVGDHVKIMECRPLSKTISFVVIEAKRGQLRLAGVDASVKEETE